jgi:signal peptidase II
MKKSTKRKTKQKNSQKKKNGWALSSIGAISLLIGFIVLCADQVSKYLVDHNIARMSHETQWYPYNGVGIFENLFGIEFSIVHATNRGAAWGIFSEYTDFLLGFRIFFISGFIIYLLLYNKSKELTVPLTLIVVGALGNVIDYFLYGHVVDMFHFVLWGYDYPVFNIADSAIFIGVFSVVIMTIVKQKSTLLSKA